MDEKYTPHTFIKVVDDPALEKIPKELLDTIEINMWFLGNSGTPLSKERFYHLHSFKDLPDKLPKLKKIIIDNSNISNFEDLTVEMPNLRGINFSDCHIHNFRGLPINKISLHKSTIDSFEGLDLPIPKNNEERQIYLQNCKIRSLGGVTRSTIQAIAIAIFSMDYRYDRPSHGDKIKLKLLTPTGRKLLLETINPQIEREFSPKYDRYWPATRDDPNTFPHFYEWHFINEEGYEQELDNADKKDWIYGFHLTEKLFIPEKLDRLHEYYCKTTRQLAEEYINDPKSLPAPQIERLVHEIDPNIRKLLENNLLSNDPVIIEIASKFSFKIRKKLKILK